MHEHLANRGQHLQVLVTDFCNDGAGETAQLAAWLEACGCRVTREFGSSQEHYTCGWIALDVADKTLGDIDAGDRFEQADLAGEEVETLNELFTKLGFWESSLATVPLWGSSPYWSRESAKNYEKYPPWEEPK